MSTARNYRENLIAKSHKASTINRRIQSIAAFLSYLDVTDKQNPFRNLKQIQIVRTAPKSIDRNESNKVLRFADNLEEKDHGLSFAIVSLLRHAGLRASELVALRVSDIDIKEKSGKVLVRNGKGFKERLVPLNLDAREGLKPWLEARKEVLKNIETRFLNKGKDVPDWVYSDFLFIGQRGVLTPRGVHHITQKIGLLANLDICLGPHRLRHTFARAALDPNGYSLNRAPVPLPALKKMLGHSRIETTSIYAEFTHDDHARFLEEREK
ncbi:tyrosine-type recombinase/integrase [Fluviispira sanaruensis]|uniref:Integrase n=1 Tax=Fluviispira sanaruensis TaxID=2493639 RepID=A0A4P2VR21_FLUSA|nr:tyrosine-type recombinase/integrase [Fluviispira sanaruensis]BBH54684.1 integrase [Fluviispira sanaruensis]